MSHDDTLAQSLTPETYDMLAGRAPAAVERLAEAFRKERFLVLRGCMSEAGLSAVRAHLDALGRDFDTQRFPEGEREAAVADMNRHVVKDAFVRALSDDPRSTRCSGS